ncbi:MAG: hypothetical protein AABY32_05420 [Nanoarchaeota archaeon]
MKKGGQVTIFIIVAVIIIGMVITFFVFKDNFNIGGASSEIAPIANFVQECMDTTLENSVYEVAKQGGYSGYSFLSRETTDSGIMYYLFDGKTSFPSKSLIEDQIGEYFERKFFLCIDDFNKFPDYEVEDGILETSVQIDDERIILDAKYPLTIKKGESTSRVEDFESKIPSRFGIVYNSVSDFMKQQGNNEKICLSCLELAVKNDIYVDMENFYDNKVVFVFRDNSSELNDKPIEWVFANRY